MSSLLTDDRAKAQVTEMLRRPVRALLVVSAVCAIALLVTLVGLLVDGRMITGAPAWLKPAKFAVSIAVYCATLAWILSLVQGHRRLVRTVAWTTGVALGIELVLIGTQVVRGTTSHFNDSTPEDGLVFSAMGALVALVFFALLVTAVLVARQDGLPQPLAAGIRGGVVVALLGMAEAGLMLANRAYGSAGGHTIGAADGGPGMPVTGWSLEHGDLRVAHFVGLHALQVLPLAAWVLHRYATSLSRTAVTRLVIIATVAYAGLVVLLAVQAERGRPLLQPDAPILAGAALLVGLVALSSLIVIRRPKAAA